jgi:hypothetical protein
MLQVQEGSTATFASTAACATVSAPSAPCPHEMNLAESILHAIGSSVSFNSSHSWYLSTYQSRSDPEVSVFY